MGYGFVVSFLCECNVELIDWFIWVFEGVVVDDVRVLGVSTGWLELNYPLFG